MSTFTRTGFAQPAATRIAEGLAEAGLAIATAGFTAAVWLSIASVTLAPDAAVAVAHAAPATAQAQLAQVQHVTLPTVTIVGRRELAQGTPVITTAQNTAAFPVNLNQ